MRSRFRAGLGGVSVLQPAVLRLPAAKEENTGLMSASAVNHPQTQRGESNPLHLQKAHRPSGSADTFGKDLCVFATTPPSKDAEPNTQLQRVVEVARWSEALGWEGTLVYTDNGLVDPWIVAPATIDGTERTSARSSPSNPSTLIRTPPRRWWRRLASCAACDWISSPAGSRPTSNTRK
jgi:hypothetical protein